MSFLDVKITYLEMVDHPNRNWAPIPEGVKIQVEQLKDPSASFYKKLYLKVGKKWLWWERLIMHNDQLDQIIKSSNVRIYLLKVDDQIAGYSELENLEDNTIRIAYFGLCETFIGQKLGKYFLDQTIKIAWSNKPEKVIVNTCDLDHPNALSVYKKSGFKPYKEETIRIKDPRELGII